MIRCTAQAKPKADLTWVKNEMSIDTQRYSTETGGIKIRGTSSESDAGKYYIYATVTETGMVETREINVEVHIKPTITQITPGYSANITEGNTETFKCSATASPYAIYSWIGPNQRNLSQIHGYRVDSNTGELFIQQVSKKDDHGSFRCIATNAAGSDEKVTQVTVFTKPVVEKFEMNATPEGSEAYINCIATGNPPPKISIKKEGLDNLKLYSGQRRINLEHKRMNDEVILTGKIINVEKSDGGEYYCIAENEAATVQRSSYLQVQYKPDLSQTVRTVKSWNGNLINLTCIADATPNASVSWYKPTGEKVINIDRNYQVFKYPNRADLQIRTVEQNVYGNYKCGALNEIGESETHVTLSEAFAPGAISVVQIIKKTTQSVIFDIKQPINDGGLPIRHYHVKYGIIGNMAFDHKNWTWPAATNERNGGYFLDRLEPEREYWFKFSAENEVGRGPDSGDISVQLPKESQPEPIVFILEDPKYDLLNGEIISQFSREFSLRWNEPSDNGRRIESYEIKYFKVSFSFTLLFYCFLLFLFSRLEEMFSLFSSCIC